MKLDKLTPTSTPQTLTVQGKNTLTVKDVLVGEVWLASGQSNMAFPVNRGQNAEQEKALANFPQMRMFTVTECPEAHSPGRLYRERGRFARPTRSGSYSAVAYFFGRELHQKLGVPVGLINSSVGGTDIAAWTSEDAQMKIPALKDSNRSVEAERRHLRCRGGPCHAGKAARRLEGEGPAGESGRQDIACQASVAGPARP